MGMMTTNWEDEETNRTIELVIQYRLEDERRIVEHVTPKSVTFHDPVTKQPQRTIRVHTAGGRRCLTKVVRERGSLEQLVSEPLASAMEAVA